MTSACTRELKACARGGGSEQLVRTILYLPGWLIGARAGRRERDAAIRPRDLRGEISGRIMQAPDTLAARGDVGSSLTHNISRGVLSTLWGRRLRHELKPRRRLCNLS